MGEKQKKLKKKMNIALVLGTYSNDNHDDLDHGFFLLIDNLQSIGIIKTINVLNVLNNS